MTLRWSVLLLSAAVLAGSSPVARGASTPELEDPVTGRAVPLVPEGRLTHLVFFATWCPPCLAELADLAELEARWSASGYRLVIVAVQVRQSRERLAGFVAERDPPGRVLFDAKGEAERHWKSSQLPTHVLLDAQGKEVARRVALDADLEGKIGELLGSAERGSAR